MIINKSYFKQQKYSIKRRLMLTGFRIKRYHLFFVKTYYFNAQQKLWKLELSSSRCAQLMFNQVYRLSQMET